jgi:hypothetical protein
MNVLICISSKTPNPLLFDCISALYKIQITDNNNYKICVVDSDSDDLLLYDKIKIEFPNVDLLFVKNKNYEYGAYKYAHIAYPEHHIYICIQDNIIINKYIDLNVVNDNNVYCKHSYSGCFYDIETKQMGIDNLKNTELDPYFYSIIDTNFNLATLNIFIVNNKIIKEMYRILTSPPTNKCGSRTYERIFGLYFILKNINTINIDEYVSKYYGGRQ